MDTAGKKNKHKKIWRTQIGYNVVLYVASWASLIGPIEGKALFIQLPSKAAILVLITWCMLLYIFSFHSLLKLVKNLASFHSIAFFFFFFGGSFTGYHCNYIWLKVTIEILTYVSKLQLIIQKTLSYKINVEMCTCQSLHLHILHLLYNKLSLIKTKKS